jgi:hypothetical protein
MPLRQHDVVLAEGRFQIVLTDRRRLFAVIEAPQTALGPLRIALEVDRRPFERAMDLRSRLGREYAVGGIFDGIGHALSSAANGVAHGIEHAAEGAFNAASKAVTTVARPVFNVVRDVSATGMHLIAQHAPFLPEKTRKSIESASRIVMRARLGDLTAKQFIRSVANAVRSGVQGARAIGDALLSGSRLVSHVLDAPLRLAGQIPGIGGVVHALSPFQKYEQVTSAIQRGDFKALGHIVKDDLSAVQGVLSFIPGVGTAVSSAISAAEAVLSGGGALEVAIHAAYGAIPIPPGLRSLTDGALESVLALAKQEGSVTDAALVAARDAVPAGLPREVFDTLAHVVVKRHPPQKSPIALVDHYVKQFATAGVPATDDDVAQVLQSARMIQPLARLVALADAPGDTTTSTALVLP